MSNSIESPTIKNIAEFILSSLHPIYLAINKESQKKVKNEAKTILTSNYK